MQDKYIVKLNNGSYLIADTRVALDSVVYSYRRGNLPETIARQFTTLSLAQIYGAIAFYLTNREEIDDYLKQTETAYEQMRKKQRESDPEFYERFDALREKRRKENLTEI